ncbi:restriction endonuclease [Luteimonas sp. Sa2BVA3]|uniref:Restriction endonuclease n=1 Tax=Luteimonas colneyensis TaxID=2762230 RepID=A0ABR8ULB2_9GAMM|nr:restriction endonuclease [Luteimonas colneyensis]
MSRAGGRGFGRPDVRNRRYDRLALLDPQEFERVVAGYYRRLGYQVEHCGAGRGGRRFDGGIDLKMYRDGSYTVVQCKRENALQVTHKVGHELLGIMLTEKADRAIVVNAGEFTPYAWESARRDTRLELIDGDRAAGDASRVRACRLARCSRCRRQSAARLAAVGSAVASCSGPCPVWTDAGQEGCARHPGARGIGCPGDDGSVALLRPERDRARANSIASGTDC